MRVGKAECDISTTTTPQQHYDFKRAGAHVTSRPYTVTAMDGETLYHWILLLVVSATRNFSQMRIKDV